jgi:hypothetical protein
MILLQILMQTVFLYNFHPLVVLIRRMLKGFLLLLCGICKYIILIPELWPLFHKCYAHIFVIKVSLWLIKFLLLKVLQTGLETILSILQVWVLWFVLLSPATTLPLILFVISYNRCLRGTGTLDMHPPCYSDWFIMEFRNKISKSPATIVLVAGFKY